MPARFSFSLRSTYHAREKSTADDEGGGTEADLRPDVPEEDNREDMKSTTIAAPPSEDVACHCASESAASRPLGANGRAIEAPRHGEAPVGALAARVHPAGRRARGLRLLPRGVRRARGARVVARAPQAIDRGLEQVPVLLGPPPRRPNPPRRRARGTERRGGARGPLGSRSAASTRSAASAGAGLQSAGTSVVSPERASPTTCIFTSSRAGTATRTSCPSSRM